MPPPGIQQVRYITHPKISVAVMLRLCTPFLASYTTHYIRVCNYFRKAFGSWGVYSNFVLDRKWVCIGATHKHKRAPSIRWFVELCLQRGEQDLSQT